MKSFLSTIRLAIIATATLVVGSSAQAEEYGAGYYGGNGNATPPANLRITIGLPKMNHIVGQVVKTNFDSRQILVRDAANRVHEVTVPPFASIAPGAQLHSDPRAFSNLNGMVRINVASGRAVDILRAG